MKTPIVKKPEDVGSASGLEERLVEILKMIDRLKRQIAWACVAYLVLILIFVYYQVH